MKKLITTVRNLVLGGAVLLSSFAQAQFTSFTPSGSYKFPQSPSYVAGRTPSSISVADAQKAYEDWKRDFVTSSGACGERRVIWDYFSGGRGKTDKSSTVSEGVAYGMLLAAYAGDKDLFDDLWEYYKKFRNGNGVMNWQIENCGVKGYNGASDAELDAAMALIVASHQWQSDSYLNEAKTMIRIVREKEFDGSVLKPGDQFGGNSLTNPSYFSPAYYRVFAELEPSQATFWNNAVTKGYQIITAADKNNNGLVPDWTDGSGNKVNDKNIDGININSTYEDGGQNFIYDAIRTPFRSAVDYLWHGDKALAGKTYCTKLIDWAYNNHNGTTNQLKSKYTTSGNPIGQDHSNTFVACFSIAAMAADGGSKTAAQYQSFLNSGYADNKNTQPGYGQYFNATFKALGFFVMSGHFYLPKDCANKPELGADKSMCSGSSVALSTTAVSGATYSWKKDGVAIAGSSNSVSATTSGAYEVLMTSQGCTSRDKVTVYGSTLTADFIAVAGPGSLKITDNSIGGPTSYTYTITKPGGTSETKATSSFELSALPSGKYTIKLVVSNAGYTGCTGSSTITKVITIGDGAGVAVDDFADANTKGIFAWTGGKNIKPIAKTYCSRADYDAGASQDCPVFGCGIAEIVCQTGTGNNPWDAWGLSFQDAAAPYDLTSVPYVSIRAKSTVPVTASVKLNQKTGSIDFTNNSGTNSKMALTTDYQVFNLDFSALLTGWDNTASKSATIAAWNSVAGLQILPFETTSTFAGTITIDYIIVGGKALPPPSFNIKQDDLGFTDYSNYLKDYYPTDPKYATCTTDDLTGLCYGAIPDWKKEASICSNTVVLNSNSCTATQVKWFKGGALVGTGDSYIASSGGTYVVELSNLGGITKDSVVVKASNTVADFTIDRDNLSAKFNNNSSDYDTFTWNYGDVANDEPGSTTWDIGYHDYATAVGALASKMFTVKLTVTNTECGTSKVATKQITVSCDSPAEFEYAVSKTTGLCEGEVITAEITSSAHAVWFGFFPPSDATTVLSTDGKTATITLGASSGDLSIQADNGCSAVNVEEVVPLANTAKPIATFTAVEEPNKKVSFDANEVGATSYTWAFGDATSGSGKTVAHTYATAKVYNACLTVVNGCGSKQTCKDVSATITGLAGEDAAGNISVYPTAVSNEIGVILPGNAKVSVIDVLGNTLREENMNDRGSINVSDLKAGMYLLNIEQNGEVITKRFVKE